MIKLYVPAITTNKTFVWDGHRKTCKIRIQDINGPRYTEQEISLPITSTSLTIPDYSGEVDYKITLTISGDTRTYTVTNIQMYYQNSIVPTYTPRTLNIFVIPTPGTYGVSNSVVKRIIFNGKEVYMTKCNKNPENENYVWAKPYTITIHKNNDCFLYESEVGVVRNETLGGVKEPGDYRLSSREGSQAGNEVIRYPIYHGEYYKIDELIIEDGDIVDIHVFDTIGPVSSDVAYNAYCTGEGDYGGGGGGSTYKYKAPVVDSKAYSVYYISSPNGAYVSLQLWCRNGDGKVFKVSNSVSGASRYAGTVTPNVLPLYFWFEDGSGGKSPETYCNI